MQFMPRVQELVGEPLDRILVDLLLHVSVI